MGGEIAELKELPQFTASKDQVREFASEARSRADAFFTMAAEGENLLAPLWFYNVLTNLGIIVGQIRHIQHHVGYCNSILRKKGIVVPWKETKL